MSSRQKPNKLYAVSKAAMLGGTVAAVLTAVGLIGSHLVRGQVFFTLDFVLSIPGEFVWRFCGGAATTNPIGRSNLYGLFRAIVNG